MGVKECQDELFRRERRSGECEILSRADECSSLVKFPIYERSPLDFEHSGQEGGYIRVSRVVS